MTAPEVSVIEPVMVPVSKVLALWAAALEGNGKERIAKIATARLTHLRPKIALPTPIEIACPSFDIPASEKSSCAGFCFTEQNAGFSVSSVKDYCWFLNAVKRNLTLSF